MGRLDAVRLLHGLGRRRGSDRLARQPRLEQEADFFSASQFRAEYNRPDIVRLVLQTKDEAEAVRRANAVAKRAAQPIG